MDPSDAVEEKVRALAEKLDRYHDKIMACRVIVEAPHKHQNKGGIYQVRIDLTVPGKELVISRDNHKNKAHEDVYVAVRDAFNAAYRKLETHTDRRSGKVKTHEEQPSGHISSISLEEGFGRIESSDGRDIYFHENSILNGDFAKLETGVQVRFSEEQGDKGPQASSVRIVGA
jgi:cold shock CspA family protein